MSDNQCQVAIVGGGLGGLSLSILLARKGHEVVLFEKERYPFHRVCGEYISNESKAFVQHLGIDIAARNLPHIDQLSINTPKGRVLDAKLDLGGFGISRYALDHALAEIAYNEGVLLLEQAKVDSVSFENDLFQIKSRQGNYKAKVVVGAFGKKSNLDVQLGRAFTSQKPDPSNNFIGIKYHVEHPDFPSNLIELSNFAGGYCGMSRIEDGKCCLCYLTTADLLRKNGNSIEQLEENVLQENPVLADRIGRSTKLFKAPIAISQVNFRTKSAVENHILMLGDAAGSIAPLAGNGMSMAFHAAHILGQLIPDFLQEKSSREQLEASFTKEWNGLFRSRIGRSLQLQRLFGRAFLTELAIGTLRHFPGIARRLVKQTHGKPFFPTEPT